MNVRNRLEHTQDRGRFSVFDAFSIRQDKEPSLVLLLIEPSADCCPPCLKPSSLPPLPKGRGTALAVEGFFFNATKWRGILFLHYIMEKTEQSNI